jgi:hypothetical protein
VEGEESSTLSPVKKHTSRSNLETERIPKKLRTTKEEDPVAQARKALEMFKEIEEEDIVASSSNNAKHDTTKKQVPSSNDKKENGKPKSSRWQKAHRMPIISMNDNQLL